MDNTRLTKIWRFGWLRSHWLSIMLKHRYLYMTAELYKSCLQSFENISQIDCIRTSSWNADVLQGILLNIPIWKLTENLPRICLDISIFVQDFFSYFSEYFAYFTIFFVFWDILNVSSKCIDLITQGISFTQYLCTNSFITYSKQFSKQNKK